MTISDEWFKGALEELAEDECLDMLAAKQVGRLAYTDLEGPAVAPVNYVMHDGLVLFRTSPHTSLGRHMQGTALAFEVDEIDEVARVGWSVLVRGRAEYTDVDDVPTAAGARPTPWPRDVRTLYVRIQPRSITGRRLR